MTSPDEVRAWSKAHRFHPHQLRHTAGTRFGRDGGAETARVLLGHRDIKTTQIYAEIDDARAREFILKIG
jgi:integrase